MDIDINSFIIFQKSPAFSVWDKGNGVLYDLCKRYPEHKNIDEVIAKIWLIGRSYAAAVERRKNKQESSDRFYIKVAKKLIDSEIDKQIQRIQEENRLTEQNIKVIGEVHSFLSRIFYELTDKYKISLASKYLHFHCPLVPLYDSRAKSSITEVFKKDKSYKELLKRLSFEANNSFDKRDKEYLGFIIKMFYLQQFLLNKTGKLYTMRDIDKYLLGQQENG